MSVDFGAVLKVAREEKNISLAQVSEGLKLSIDKIEDIESSNVGNLPPAAFTCGYLRLFSKLVEVDENEIIEMYYHAIGEVPETVLPSSTSDIPSQADIKHPGMRLVSFSVVILIIILSIVWWNDRGDNGDDAEHAVVTDDSKSNESLDSVVESTEADENEGNQIELESGSKADNKNEKNSLSTPEKNENNTPLTETDTIPLATETSKLENVQEDAVADNQLESDSVVESVDTADQPEPEELKIIQEEENIKLARMASPVAEVGVDTVQLNALDDCWVEISDANEHLLYFSLLKKDEEVHLSGQEPFKVFLGKADAVEIKLNDINYDVSAFVRSNQVARFTMSMEEAKKMQDGNN